MCAARTANARAATLQRRARACVRSCAHGFPVNWIRAAAAVAAAVATSAAEAIQANAAHRLWPYEHISRATSAAAAASAVATASKAAMADATTLQTRCARYEQRRNHRRRRRHRRSCWRHRLRPANGRFSIFVAPLARCPGQSLADRTGSTARCVKQWRARARARYGRRRDLFYIGMALSSLTRHARQVARCFRRLGGANDDDSRQTHAARLFCLSRVSRTRQTSPWLM